MSNLTQPEPEEDQNPRHSVTNNALVNSNASVTSDRPLLQYRNGFFQGFVNEFDQRQGKGVYYWNSGEIYYGDWNLDRMEGEGIFYFALGGYVYGTFLDDKVHGYAILCFSNGDYIAGFWERGLLSGKAVQYSKTPNDWCLYEYKDGTSERTLMTGKGTPPIHTFSMLETYYLKKLIERDLSLFGEENPNQEKSTKNIDFLPIDPDGWYHGNLKSRGPHGLGIVCYSEHKSDRGIFKEGAVNGPGRSLFESGDVYDGFYKDGKFHGVGVYFKSETEQYLYGMYENNECVQALTLGNGYPHELMKTLKTDFKLDNVDFIDKETESEVLTLSSQDQSMAEAIEQNQNRHLIENAHEGLFDKFLAQDGGKKILEAPNKLEEIKEEKVHEIAPKDNEEEKNSNNSRKSVGGLNSPQKVKNQSETRIDSNRGKQSSSGSKNQEEIDRKIKTVEIKTSQSVEVDKRGQPQTKSDGNLDSHRKSDKVSIDNYISRENEGDEEHVIIRKTSKNSQEKNSQNKFSSKPNLTNSQHISEKSANTDKDVSNRVTFRTTKLGSFSEEQTNPENQGGNLKQYKARTSEMLEKEPTSQIPENISRPYQKYPPENNVFLQELISNPPADGRPYTEANSPEWRSLTHTPARSVKSEADRNSVKPIEGKVNRNEHTSINNEVQKIMEQIFGNGIPSNQELEGPQRSHDVNGSFGSPQKELQNHEYIGSMSFRKPGSEHNTNKMRSASKNDIDSYSDLQAKTQINKQLEHSQVSNYDNSTPRRDEEKSSEDVIRRDSKIESGRMITDTWSLYTGGSQTGGYQGTKPPGYKGNDGLSSEYHLVREVTSEVLDSSRYNPKKKEFSKAKANDYANESLDKEEEVYKIMLHKMELLMREQSKTVETMDEMKRSINSKNFDSTKEILKKMYQELVELNRLSHISLSVVHTKLDSLLLQQGCKPSDLESIRGNSQTLMAQEVQKQAVLQSPQRPEIYIVDSHLDQSHQVKRNMEEKRLFEKDSPELASAQIFRSQYGNINEPRSSASTYEQPNSAHYLLSGNKKSPFDSKMEYNDELANYMSVTTDSAPLKQIHSMTPNSRQFAVKNESTFSQYDDRLRNSQENSGQSHLTNSGDKNKSSVQQSADYIPSTPGKKPGSIAFTTPQSKTNAIYQEDYAKKMHAQIRSPIQSNRSSLIMETHVSPDRFTKPEGYTSKLSQTSSHSKTPAIIESRDQARHSFSNHVSPDKLRQSKYDSKRREEPGTFNGPRKWHNEVEEKKNVEKSSFGTNGSKAYENIRTSSNHNSTQHNLPEERRVRERFTVTSNNNRIPTNDEYIHIDKGNVINRNIGTRNENIAMSAKKFTNDRTSWRNSADTQDLNSTTYHELGVSPLRYRREPVVVSPLRPRNTVHEGRLGTVRWRLELEQVEDDYDRIPQRDSMVDYRTPEQWNYINGNEANHENILKGYLQMRSNKTARSASMMGVPSQERRWDGEEGPVKQETQAPYDYHSSNRQVHKLSEKAKQNYLIDVNMPSLAKTSEIIAKPSQYEQSLPKRENYNLTSSSYVKEDEVMDERHKNYDSGMNDNYFRNSGVGHRQGHL